MKENEKELVDLDEEGNVKEEKEKKEPKKLDSSFKIIATIIIGGIIIGAIIFIFKQLQIP